MGQLEPTGRPAASGADASGPARVEIVRRLRQQVEAGAYDPPVEEVVDRLVHLILCRQAAHRPDTAN